MSTITDRIDAITRIPDSHRKEDPPAPRSVKVEVTGRCDFRCFFCAGRQGLRFTAHMDRDVYRTVVRKARGAGVEELGVFYLGESFILPWLPDLIREGREAGYPYIFLTTNGRLATSDRVEACIRSGLDSLKFSFNSPDGRALHDMADVPEEWFDRIVANVRAAREVRDRVLAETGRRCGIYASSIAFGGEQQARMEAAVGLVRPHVDQHYWLPLYNQASLTSEDCERHGYRPSAGNQGRVGALREPIPCWALFTEGHVTWDGTLTGCCFAHTPAFDFGDLRTQDFMEAWHSGRARELRRAHLAKDLRGTPCERCVAYQ